MAQEVKVVLICDRCEDRTEAETTETFAVGGQGYEIDLCAKHKKDLDKVVQALQPWAEQARRAGWGTRASGSPGRPARAPRGSRRVAQPAQPPYDESACRAWALKEGLNVKATGRLSPTTIKAWRDAGSPKAA